MEKIIIMIVTYVISLIEVVMYYEFMSSRFESNGNRSTRNRSTRNRWVVYIGGTIVTNMTQLVPWAFPIRLCINMMILTSLGHLIFKKKYFEEFIFTAFYLLIINLLDLITIGVFGSDKQFFNKISENELSYFYIQLGMISKIILIALTKFFVKMQSKRVYELTPQITRIMGYGFGISLASISLLILVFFKIGGIVDESVNLWLNIVAVGIFLNSVIIYYAIQKLAEWISRKKEYEVAQYQNEVLIKTTLEKDEMNKEVRKIWHDFNNHMSCIDMLLQMNNVEKARAYIKNMNASCQTIYMGIKTGNEMADVVVNQKFVLAQNQGIEMRVNGTLDEHLNINQMDLCALLCNSLDNAIEASCQIEEKTNRIINVTLKMHKDYLFIEVVNNVKQVITTQHKYLPTTKKNKLRHGIGMISMQNIVEKYRGNLEWKCENNQFLLSIMLNNELK